MVNADVILLAGENRRSLNDAHRKSENRTSDNNNQNTGDSIALPSPSEDSNSNDKVESTTFKIVEEDPSQVELNSTSSDSGWSPTGVWWKDLLFFCGPGWLVSIAYVDPGNYQADIQAGATSRYNLLFAVWWSSIYSMYVQVLCVRLGYRTKMSLSEVQAHEYNLHGDRWKVYVAWIIAEFSVVITDLPEVIGFGIALNIFFGLPYWIGVLLSLITTMLFLATQRFGIQTLEIIIFTLVGIMSIALFVEMGFVRPDVKDIIEGWVYGFIDVKPDDIFVIVGILGSVCMPHNLYLHSGTCQERKINSSDPRTLDLVVKYCSWEPVVPIIVTFFVNMAVLSIAAESVYGTPNAANVGLTDFCHFFTGIKGGCILWGIALLAAGQSSAITTTYAGQFVMDGFLNIRLNVKIRAIVTRLVAILPCVLIAALLPNYLNQLVNWVNALLAILLPFALLPLIKYNCSPAIMGEFATKGWEKYTMYTLGVIIYLVNCITISCPGGGFFGDYTQNLPSGTKKIGIIILQVIIQGLYLWWSCMSLFKPINKTNGGDSLNAIANKKRKDTEEEIEKENNNAITSEKEEKKKEEKATIEEAKSDEIAM